MAQARKARGINRTEKRKRGSVTYSANREDEASEIFIFLVLCLPGSERISIHAKRLQISDARQKQNE